MDVNYEVWGQPETWVDGSTSQQRADIKFPAAAQDTFQENYQNGHIPWNEIDLSLSYWGIGKGSIWANPHLLYPYCPTGTLANLEVDEASPVEEEVSSIPAIFTAGTTINSTYVSYGRRYKNLYPEEQTTGHPLGNSYTTKVLTGFNYQKVMIVPYVYYYDANTDHGGLSYSTYKDFFDNINDRIGYKILGIAYKIRWGDGETNRTSEGASFGLVWPTEYRGNTGTYDSKPYFASAEGMSHLTETAFMTAGTVPAGIKTADERGDATIGTSETGFRKKYCVNTGTSVPIYYYDKDNELWEVYKNTYVSGSYTNWVYFPCIIVRSDNIQAVQEYLISQIAYLGLPFVIDPAVAVRGKIGDTGVYLPKFDEDGITTGEYEEGAAALTLPNAEWVDGRTGSGYDPTKPIPGGDTGDDGVEVRPSNPAFTLAGRGTQCYAITPADMTEIFTDIYGRSQGSFQDLTEGLALFGADPMGAIISYKWYPFNFEPNTNASIVLGTTEINPSHTYPIIQNVLSSMKNFKGTFRLQANKDFINSRATQARLYLPFYGFYELPMPQLISHELEIEFHYNVPDEVGTWIISWNNVIYDFLECDPAIEIPLTGTNARGIRQAKVGAALNIAATVAQTAATVGIGVASFSTGIAAAAGGAVGAAQALGEQGALAWGKQVATASTRATNFSTGAGIVGALANGYNGISNAVASVNRLKVNVPFHPASDATTFLNLSMVPYLQLYTNQPIVDYSGNSDAPRQYMLKVGIACDKWVTTSSMPDESLLKTTGIANMDINGMELSEIQELNSILQSGFYK